MAQGFTESIAALEITVRIVGSAASTAMQHPFAYRRTIARAQPVSF